MLQLSGEIFDLDKFFKKKPDLHNDPEPGRCSGLVKVILEGYYCIIYKFR